LSADNYIVVDHDGDVFQIYEGSMSDKLEIGDYEPVLIDSADTVAATDLIVGKYRYVEYGTEWTDAANKARAAATASHAAVEKAIEKLSELNIKVVNLANKLDAHLKEPDAHNPSMLYKK